ncbi:ATP-binding protein [Amycolatopsis thermoflava]|uniref:ATP-binding protein n=1 Tax=Amycolatopsis thermoflava TaxID=84480 RepID=UPI003820A35A
MTDPDRAALVLDFEPDAVPPLVAVRRWAASALADLGEDHLTAVLLAATELVTNAYDHGGGPRRLRLHRDEDPCRIHLEVDDDSAMKPVLTDSTPGDRRGRGLRIVNAVAHDWGSRHSPDGGKTVWATINCAVYGWDPCPTPPSPEV